MAKRHNKLNESMTEQKGYEQNKKKNEQRTDKTEGVRWISQTECGICASKYKKKHVAIFFLARPDYCHFER